jgi:putative toxin-antitoxin system antitoxin component (TIGR02293 family)
MSSRSQRRAEIYALASKVIGGDEAAAQWMRQPAFGLEGQIPARLIGTVAGTRLVKDYLMQIEHSVFV